jgi:hypothetical protein
MLGGLLPGGASVVGWSEVPDWDLAYFESVYSRETGVEEFGGFVERGERNVVQPQICESFLWWDERCAKVTFPKFDNNPD